LTPAEAEVARRFYEGPSDTNTGARLTAGQPLYGSELNWKGVYVAETKAAPIMSRMAAEPVLRYLAFAQPDSKREVSDLAFTEATLAALRPRHPLFDATNTNLAAFEQSRGKLILWHGLADPHIAPANTIAFHKALSVQLGPEVLETFERLYLLPGVSHCGGGEGPSHIDLVSAMLAWVERGVAPGEIRTASRGEPSNFGQPEVEGGKPASELAPAPPMAAAVEPLPNLTRPVYPYPYVARYKGFGDPTDTASWERGEPKETVRLHTWPGEDLFGPYVPAEN
jgi:feruloyl esterase